MFDTKFGAEPVELMVPRSGPCPRGEAPVSEIFSPRQCLSDQWRSNGSIGQYLGNLDRAGPVQIA